MSRFGYPKNNIPEMSSILFRLLDILIKFPPIPEKSRRMRAEQRLIRNLNFLHHMNQDNKKSKWIIRIFGNLLYLLWYTW